MIKVKVTKNVLNKNSVINFSVKQIVFGVLGCILGVATYFLLKDYVQQDLLSILIFVELALVIGFGVININGKSLFSLIIFPNKGDKRPYSHSNYIKGDNNNEL